MNSQPSSDPSAEAGDQAADDEARRVHGDHMPLDSRVGMMLRQAMHAHCERGRSLKEVREEKRYEPRRTAVMRKLASDDPERTSHRLRPGDGNSAIDLSQEQQRQRGKKIARQVGANEVASRDEVHRHAEELSANQACQYAASYHGCQRSRFGFRRHAVGRCEAECQDDRGISASQ